MLKHKGTVELTTPRLLLRRFRPGDEKQMFENWATDERVVKYLTWPMHESMEQTREIIRSWIGEYEKNDYYHWVIQMGGVLVGAINLHNIIGHYGCAELGYNLGSRWWGQGIMTEAVEAVMDFFFRQLGGRRLVGRYDPDNIGSGRVMEKLGMQLEGVSRQSFLRRDGTFSDIAWRAILKEEWEIREYGKLKCGTDAFVELPELREGNMTLVCAEKQPEIPEKKYVPAYRFYVMVDGHKVGRVDLRLGYPEVLFFSGQIGYYIDEAYRGRGYAVRACKLLRKVMQAQGMERAYISNAAENAASRRVCEKLEARHVGLYQLPPGHDLRQLGQDYVNIYEYPAE